MGSAKGQSSGGSGLVLREDQGEWQNAVRMEQGRQRKAERKLQKGVDDGRGAGTWRDADWMPEMYSAGMSGKGRSDTGGAFMPDIGHGRRNPNQVRRGKGKK
jgi:RNA-binding protein NOB1